MELLIAIVAGAVLLGIIVLWVFLALIWRRVVPTNMVHIVQSSKKTISYGRGRDAGNTYYEIPSQIPMLGIEVIKFPESVFDIILNNYEAYDIGRLPFVVDVRAFFRITDSQVAAQRVANFDQLKDQLQGVLQGAVRRVLATNQLEKIMEDRAALGQQFTSEVDLQLKEWGVGTVKMIEFMDIRDSRDSKVIENIMAKEKSRIEMESRITVADNRRTAEMREIEATRSVESSRIEAEQKIGSQEAEKEQVVGIAREKSNQQVQLEAKTTAERLMDVRRVENVRSAEIAREVATVKAEEDRKVLVVNAEGQKESTVRIAEGTLEAVKREAEGVSAIGKAKAEAETAILLAPVTAATTLADTIGENEGYQKYLINIRNVEATEKIGTAMADAMSAAEMKVIANSGSVQGGITSLADMFTPTGGTSIAGMMEALAQTDQGSALLKRLTGNDASTDNAVAKSLKASANNKRPAAE